MILIEQSKIGQSVPYKIIEKIAFILLKKVLNYVKEDIV